jgi:AraC family L-rhamnose operon regulatory protein RhaS
MQQRNTPVEVRLPENGVFILESHHAPGFRMAPSAHDFLEIFFILQGGGSFRVGDRIYPGHTGDVVVVPVGQVHQIEDQPGAPLSLYGICVAPAVYRLDPSPVEALPPGRLALNELVLPRLRADLREMLFEQTLARTGHRLLLVGLALQWLGVLARGNLGNNRRVGGTGGLSPPHPQGVPAAPAPSTHLLAVQQYVAELPQRFFESADLDHTSSALGMSRRRFTQLFRGVTGTSWHDHLTALRIDYACRLLRETQRNVVAIAFECGFEDLSSFYRAFKRRTGLPPSEWRQKAST